MAAVSASQNDFGDGVRAVLVVGVEAEQVADRVAELRASGRRASGFVGDDMLAAEAMATELFGGDADVEQVQSRS